MMKSNRLSAQRRVWMLSQAKDQELEQELEENERNNNRRNVHKVPRTDARSPSKHRDIPE